GGGFFGYGHKLQQGFGEIGALFLVGGACDHGSALLGHGLGKDLRESCPIAVVREQAREAFVFEFPSAVANQGPDKVPAVDEHVQHERIVLDFILFLGQGKQRDPVTVSQRNHRLVCL